MLELTIFPACTVRVPAPQTQNSNPGGVHAPWSELMTRGVPAVGGTMESRIIIPLPAKRVSAPALLISPADACTHRARQAPAPAGMHPHAPPHASSSRGREQGASEGAREQGGSERAGREQGGSVGTSRVIIPAAVMVLPAEKETSPSVSLTRESSTSPSRYKFPVRCRHTITHIMHCRAPPPGNELRECYNYECMWAMHVGFGL